MNILARIFVGAVFTASLSNCGGSATPALPDTSVQDIEVIDEEVNPETCEGDACLPCVDDCPAEDGSECTDGQVRKCVRAESGCLVWTAPEACPEGFCINGTDCGTCAHECASVGETKCLEGKVQACEADPNGCRRFGAPAGCTRGFCADVTKCGECANTCAGKDLKECKDGKIKVCEADRMGCLAWGAD